jgi:hypothetical protein
MKKAELADSFAILLVLLSLCALVLAILIVLIEGGV